jgi:putative transposase
MSKKRTTYTAELKSKLVLELLKNEKTLAEIASFNNITPKNLQNWKKIFLENAVIAMEPSKAVKEYKEELVAAYEENEMLTKIVGKMTVEKEWLEKKLKGLDLSDKKQLIEFKPKEVSLSRQCELLALNRSSLYYQNKTNVKKDEIKNHITKIFEEIPIYGAKKVHQQLLEDGFDVSLNTVSSYRQQLGLKAILAVKQANTTIPNKAHKKYSYKLRGLDILHANQVWSTDITYIKINGGMVYLAAIIDWHSKAVLSHKISNTMDCALVMDVLDEAISSYGTPDIFNTDQGSQYTSEVHTQRLKKKGITISMDGKGRATDNICIERFWRSAKCERIYLNEYESINALREDVDDYIDFYNYRRFHETLDYKKPMSIYTESLAFNKKSEKAS